MMDHWKTGIRIVSEGTRLDSTQEEHQCMLSSPFYLYSFHLAFSSQSTASYKKFWPLIGWKKRSTKKRKGKRLFCVKHAHTHVQSGVKAIVLSLKNLRPIARSLIVSLLSTTTSRVILLLVRIKSKSITDPKRTSGGFVNQGNWEVGRLGEGWVKRLDRKFSKYLFLFGKNQRFCLEVIWGCW